MGDIIPFLVLWFDVEEGYNTTGALNRVLAAKLWFDVEERYHTTIRSFFKRSRALWFDVEERYNTTYRLFVLLGLCCGLISIKDTRRPPFRHTKRGGLFMGIKKWVEGRTWLLTLRWWKDVLERPGKRLDVEELMG